MGMFDKKELDIVPLGSIEKTIMISITKYEELLIIKGKYLELKNQHRDLVDSIMEKIEEGKITPNQAREIFGMSKVEK